MTIRLFRVASAAGPHDAVELAAVTGSGSSVEFDPQESTIEARQWALGAFDESGELRAVRRIQSIDRSRVVDLSATERVQVRLETMVPFDRINYVCETLGADPPYTAFSVRGREDWNDDSTPLLLRLSAPARLRVGGLVVGRNYVWSEQFIDRDSTMVLRGEQAAGRVSVWLRGITSPVTVLLSSHQRARMLDNAFWRRSESANGEHRRVKVVRDGLVVFDGLRDAHYSVLVFKFGAPVLIAQKSRIPSGSSIVVDLTNATPINAPKIHLTGPDGNFAPEWGGTLRYDIYCFAYALDGVLPARSSVELPRVHGVATLTFLPDDRTAHLLAVTSTIIDITEQGPYEMNIRRAGQRVPCDLPGEDEVVFVGQDEGMPRARLSAEEARSLWREGGFLVGMPERSGVYLLTAKECVPLRRAGGGSRLVLHNAARIDRYIAVEVGGIPIRKSVTVPANGNVVVIADAGACELQELGLFYTGGGLVWKRTPWRKDLELFSGESHVSLP